MFNNVYLLCFPTRQCFLLFKFHNPVYIQFYYNYVSLVFCTVWLFGYISSFDVGSELIYSNFSKVFHQKTVSPYLLLFRFLSCDYPHRWKLFGLNLLICSLCEAYLLLLRKYLKSKFAVDFSKILFSVRFLKREDYVVTSVKAVQNIPLQY